MRADVDDDLVAAEHTRAAVVQANFDGLRPYEAPATHDQRGAAGLIGVEVKRDLASRSIISCLPRSTFAMSVDTGPVTVPNSAA
jgi:hypothetical protein